MSKKNTNLNRLKNSDLFPDDLIPLYKEKYEELIEEQEAQIKSKIVELSDKGFDVETIKNAILSKYNYRLDFG